MRPILIGTGFHAGLESHDEQVNFLLGYWLSNTRSPIVIIDNSYVGLPKSDGRIQIFRIRNNLGYTGDRNVVRGNRIMGWSMSWILPAMVAYSENCDFIYKEQDCLAFGDWVPVVRGNGRGFRCGRYSRMDAEQSLFFLERDFIPDFVSAYLSLKQSDLDMLPESKGPAAAKLCGITDYFFDMPFGRERPLTIYKDRPWYAQRFTPEELQQVKEAGLI